MIDDREHARASYRLDLLRIRAASGTPPERPKIHEGSDPSENEAAQTGAGGRGATVVRDTRGLLPAGSFRSRRVEEPG